MQIIHIRGLEIGVRIPVRRGHAREVVLLVVLGHLGNAVVVGIFEGPLLGRMHQDFSARDVAEGEKRVDRQVLRTRQAMTGDSKDCDRAVGSSRAGPQIVCMGPVGHII